MTWKQVFTSSVGKKLIMGLTGISLVLFLIVHAGINACVFADLVDPDENGEMFNKAAHFMGSTVLIRITEIGLFAGIILHIAQGLLLTAENKKRRNVGYAVPYTAGSKWYSRSMGLLGTLILLFLVLHLYHFWASARFTGRGLEPVSYNGVEMHNMFGLMKATFSEWWVVILYALGCLSLYYHLAHGFQSAFKTLGVHNKRYNAMLSSLGYGFSAVITIVFILMPLSFVLGWIG
ncbi:MAG TPA: succinate dehydrogenase cytochrome b subunit [Sediminibacterium sp.]|nr:succinate dehydrogenase cytochrome b subunit [Sediminibacterium sp.]